MRAFILGLIAVVATTTASGEDGKDGQEVVVWVPEGQKVVLVPAEAPVACIALEFIELARPDDGAIGGTDCAEDDLILSPGCP